jgi:hypothetical protein
MNNISGLEEENKGKDSRLIYFGVYIRRVGELSHQWLKKPYKSVQKISSNVFLGCHKWLGWFPGVDLPGGVIFS